jgi:hypothetical protein
LASATYGNRYVFAGLDQKTLGVTTRADLTFTTSLSFQLFLQVLSSAGHYAGFKELERPRSFDFLEYGSSSGGSIRQDPTTGNYQVDPDGGGPAKPFTFANPDIALRALRGTAVLRWEYRPGATLFVVWTQSRSGFDQTGDFGGLADLPRVFGVPADNIFLIKLTYWLSR